MPPKLDRCVSDVQDQGHDEPSAYAICNDSIQEINDKMFETHNPLDIPFGHEVNEGGPGSGRKATQPHGKPMGQLPPAHTPKSKPSMPSSAITPMGKGKTSGINETEGGEDRCAECGKRRDDHGMFSDHDFEEDLAEMDEGEEDAEIKSIKIDFVTESFSIPGSLSAQSVGAKKHQETICACDQFDGLLRALRK